MLRTHHLLLAAFAAATMPLTPVYAQNSREAYAESMKEFHEANMKTTAEYICNMSLINLERRNALDMMNGKTPPLSRYDSIIAKATECLKEVGPKALAYDYRAKAYVRKGDAKNALADFEKAIASAKTEKSPIAKQDEILEARADLYMSLGERAKAEADLREALRLNPSAYTAKDKLDNLDTKMAEARKKAIIANPKTAEDYVVVGTDHYNLGRYDKAIAAFDKSISLSPSAAAYTGKGKAYWVQSRFDAALPEMDKAVSLSPKDGDALLWRGHVHRELKRWDEAIADYTKALSVSGKQKTVLLSARGTAYAAKGDHAAALKDHEAALASAGSDVYAKINAYTGKGDALRGQGKTADAVAAYNAAIAAAGTDYFAKLNLPDAYLGRGRLYASQGKPELAKADFNEILKLVPDFKEAKAELAKLSGNAAPAGTNTDNIKKAEAAAMEGRRAANAQKWDDAVKSFTECIRLAPDSPACYAFRGAVLGIKGDLSASRNDFDKALKLGKNNPAILLMRGQMHAQLGKKQEAVYDFRQVLKANPGNPQAIKALELLGEKP